MAATLTGDRELVRKFDRMGSRSRLSRMAARPLAEAARVALRVARRRGFGFTDRSGRLRQSIGLVRTQVAEGRHVTTARLVATAPYARYVEWRPRTRDARPGPPFLLHRAMRIARQRVVRTLHRELRESIEREARR